MSAGTLYALGLGPGDPDLMTVRARRLLQSVSTLVVPTRSARHTSYALTIVAALIDRERQEVVLRPFPTSPEGWAELADELVQRTATGDVAFLVEGDPLLFGSFVDVLRNVKARHPDAQVEIVPGIPSFLAASAAVQVPVADGARGVALVAAPITAEALAPLLPLCSTLVLLKVAPVLDETLQTLRQLHLEEDALLARRIGRPEQVVLVGADAIRAAPRAVTSDYFSLLLAPIPEDVRL